MRPKLCSWKMRLFVSDFSKMHRSQIGPVECWLCHSLTPSSYDQQIISTDQMYLHIWKFITYSPFWSSGRWPTRLIPEFLHWKPKRIGGSCEHRLGDYEQEAEQIQPGHKLLNGKLVRNHDLNSPITEEKIGKKYPLTWSEKCGGNWGSLHATVFKYCTSKIVYWWPLSGKII